VKVLLLWTLLLVPQAEDGWKVGLADTKITPEEPIHLAGYASRNKPFTGVAADLHAKALAIEDAQGNRAVLVTSDLLGFRASIAEPICERLREKAGLKREQIILSSSHTHTGPLLTLEPAAQGNLKAEDAEKSTAYTKRLQDKVVDVVAQALSRMEPAKLSWGWGVATFPMNRREFTPTGVKLGVNPRGPVDRTVPVLRVDAPDGKPRAVLFGCACHNTTLGGDIYEVSGDYAGFAQAHIEAERPGVQAMFMIGCGGDANPHPRGTMAVAREHGATLGKEVLRVLDTKLAPVRGPLKTAFQRAALPLQEPLPLEELKALAAKGPDYKRGVAQKQLDAIQRGERPATQYAAPIAAWQFGDDLTLVALSGEVVADYVTFIVNALGPLKLWVAAYCNDVFGYLPSARVIEEGGYETRGVYYGDAGFFAPQAQDVVTKTVRDLAEKVGRPPKKQP
jgi:hypothetical protein